MQTQGEEKERSLQYFKKFIAWTFPGGDLLGIYRIALRVAEGIAEAFAEGFGAVRQIDDNLREGNLIRHSSRSRDGNGGVIQGIILGIVQVVFRTGTCPLDIHGNLIGSAVIHADKNHGRTLVDHFQGGVGHCRGIRGGVGKGDLFTGFLDIAQIDLDTGIAGIDFVQIIPGTCQMQRNRLGGTLLFCANALTLVNYDKYGTLI